MKLAARRKKRKTAMSALVRKLRTRKQTAAGRGLLLKRGKSARARWKKRSTGKVGKLNKRKRIRRLKRSRIRKGLPHINKLLVPVWDQPLVSIIIPVYNKWDFTYPCLVSIVENTRGIPYEIIVVDDISDDLTVHIRQFVKHVTVIRNKVKRGFLHNCNHGAEISRGKYVLFLNNDTQVTPGWLEHLLSLPENDPTIGIVGSKLIYPDGRLQEAGGIVFKNGFARNYGRLDNPNKHEYNYVKEVDYISGASLMIRKDLWNQMGGFDVLFAPAYSEDVDIAFQARQLGYKVVFQPKSVVVHYEGISHGTDLNSGIKKYQVINQQKFREKWAEVLERDHLADGEHLFWARERSKDKKTILVIDYGVPSFDQDAGSRTTFMYLKLLVDMGLNVKFIPDNFTKLEPYGSELEQLGIEIIYGTQDRGYYEYWIVKHKDYIDYILLNRPNISHKYIDLIKAHTRAKILYYGHDLHYVRELKRFGLDKNRGLLQESEYIRRLEFDLFTKADTILTCSDSEKRIIDGNFPNKSTLWLPAYYFDQTVPKIKAWDERSGLLFVGGFKHTPNADGILWFCRDILPIVQQSIPDIQLFIVGSHPTQEVLGLQSDRIIVKGFVSDHELKELYGNIKIAVIPLRYGAGVKGKTIEAMCHQTPLVTTSTGIEGLQNIRQSIEPKNTPQEFAEEIIRLYHNNSLLEHKAEQCKQYVETYYSRSRALECIKLAL
ncbi:glycosyltransferase [Bacillus sp. 3255]|uniref:glycosyltransferase n=1 Tax=Bacillus sp. 3255 TaxID=2817904 RepID=UPI00285D3DB8|nr:glycosyltransferase [Bacillus sp. 3255]MDR6880871.1 GT2 family glycosyltransferase/glycosyltransferase involved in cell wall biosynthesis [Bacillus sp. 3255]